MLGPKVITRQPALYSNGKEVPVGTVGTIKKKLTDNSYLVTFQDGEAWFRDTELATYPTAEIAFTKVALPYGWLGNMAPYPITIPAEILNIEGENIFRTSEALFQAMRFTDRDIIIAIWGMKSPMAAKMVAKRYAAKMVVTPRSAEDLANMDKVIGMKLEQHPTLVDQLVETGDQQIIEDCSNRRNDSGLFWGAAKVDGQWVGRNELGKIWMVYRSRLVPEKSIIV